MKPKASNKKGFNHLKLVKNTELIDLSLINLYESIQSRKGFNLQALIEYEEVWNKGNKFPPVDLFFDGQTYWIGDGFHRIKSRLSANLRGNKIEAIVHQGSKRDAFLHSVGANSQHGVRCTNEDKRHAVTLLLKDEEWAQWSNREIARQCGVSHEFVANIRKQISGSRSQIERKVRRGGSVYTQRVQQPSPTLTNPIVSISKNDGLQELISSNERSKLPQGVCRRTGYSFDYARSLLVRKLIISPTESENILFQNCWNKAHGWKAE